MIGSYTHATNQIIDNKSDWIAIVSRRRDDFKGTISHITAEITNEYNGYSNGAFPQKYVSLENFVEIFSQRNNFYNELDTTGYAKVVDIYLEDVLQYPYHLFEQLGQRIEMPIWTEQSPYNGKLIANFDELEKYYQNHNGSLTSMSM